MLDVSPDQIRLWLVFLNDVQDEYLLRRYRSILSEDELRRECCFHFIKDQRRYVITRALARLVLSRYAQIEPKQLTFAASAFGKPEISNASCVARRISFNISHSQSAIALAVTRDCALGVDTENLRSDRVSLETAACCLSQDEFDALSELPIEIRHERFFEYWTLKEAYVKARGMGLSIPFDEFGFYFRGERKLEISIPPHLDASASRWRFWQFRAPDENLIAVCSERSISSHQQLIMKKIIPLCEEGGLAYESLRKSV